MRRWMIPASATLFGALLLTACSDARLKNLSVGISPDSVAAVMGHATPHRTFNYAAGGAVWELRLYSRKEAAANDSIPWRKLSPVVFANGNYIGSGWAWWDGQAAKLGIPMPK